jgi:hypothetical protein
MRPALSVISITTLIGAGQGLFLNIEIGPGHAVRITMRDGTSRRGCPSVGKWVA